MKSNNTYWSYIKTIFGKRETWKNGKLEVLRDEYEIDASNDLIGKYSSLQEAIRGFVFDELNRFSEVTVKFDIEDNNCFKLSSEIYYDISGNLVNDVLLRKWKSGEYPALIHAKIDAIFIEHTERKATIENLSKILIQFPDFKIDK